MSSKLSKILTAIIFVIAVIAAVLFINVFIAEEDELYSKVNPLVEFSAWLLYITLAITLIFSVVNIFKHPEEIKKIVINLAILAAVYFVAYLTASDAAVLNVQGQVLKGGDAGSVSKLISTIINFSVYLGVIAIAAVGLGTVKTAIK
ncbi:hypothetical protein QVZ41_11305 [Wenyingzhuangia sp. chi5]|uniref:Uncharacterized protein n=1 Tax=Wenyingzhuangia gilva TaxID=3057677 RepID=A0ABT8VTY2_9FLAO|nr:hypothetical protein [Wenyingzhuangia sp. chi5]MDO3695426.1 hypothetical protein [Wenyingzhuangia sp. chi5]